MDSEYKVSDHDNTGAKGKNTEYVLLMLFAHTPQKSRVISPFIYGSKCMAELQNLTVKSLPGKIPRTDLLYQYGIEDPVSQHSNNYSHKIIGS